MDPTIDADAVTFASNSAGGMDLDAFGKEISSARKVRSR
jgi:hypothetical protein